MCSYPVGDWIEYEVADVDELKAALQTGTFENKLTQSSPVKISIGRTVYYFPCGISSQRKRELVRAIEETPAWVFQAS